jgi:tetratricopeptide (TPR) repeat protein
MVAQSESGPTSRPGENGLFTSPGGRTVICSLLLVVVTLVLYNPVIHNGFINLDDNLYILDNPNVTAGLHLWSLKWAFLTCEQANWHPLTWLSHALDWQLFKKNAAGHHYTSLLFHAFNVVLLFLLLQSATGYRWRSLGAAVLFAAHPANVESVAWAAERKNVLSMMFFLLAMLAYGWYARRPSLRRYSLVPLLFALGLMAKPQVITLPCVLLLWDYWPLERFGSRDATPQGHEVRPRFAPASPRWLVLEKMPLFLLAAGDALITMHAQRVGGAVRTLQTYPGYLRLENAVVCYVRYVAHAFWPFQLSPTYSHPATIPAWQTALSLVFLLCVTGSILLVRKRYLLVGWLWFLGSMVPMIGIVQVGDQAMADRYAYTSFLGLFFMAVWLIADVAARWQVDPKLVAVFASAVLALCCLLSRQLLGYWHDSEALWSYAIQVDDHDFMAHANLGRILVFENRPQEAISEFIMAENLHLYPPDDVLILVSYELRKGEIPDAEARCRQVLRQTKNPHLQEVAFTDLGVASLRLGDLKQAKVYFGDALKARPGSPGALLGLGVIAERDGNLNSAIDYFSHSAKAEPNDLAYFFLAVAYERSNREAEAHAAFAQAQRVSDNMKDALEWAQELLPAQNPSPAASSGITSVGLVAGR